VSFFINNFYCYNIPYNMLIKQCFLQGTPLFHSGREKTLSDDQTSVQLYWADYFPWECDREIRNLCGRPSSSRSEQVHRAFMKQKWRKDGDGKLHENSTRMIK